MSCWAKKTTAFGPAYVIGAKPRPGYRGKAPRYFIDASGQVLIDKGDYHWVKVEAETLDAILFGLFIARRNLGDPARPEISYSGLASNSSFTLLSNDPSVNGFCKKAPFSGKSADFADGSSVYPER